MNIVVEGAASVASDAAQLRVIATLVRKYAWELAGEGNNGRPVATRNRTPGQVDVPQARAFQVEPQILASSRTVQLMQRWRCHLKESIDASDDE
jgi:hypothetical protein